MNKTNTFAGQHTVGGVTAHDLPGNATTDSYQIWDAPETMILQFPVFLYIYEMKTTIMSIIDCR